MQYFVQMSKIFSSIGTHKRVMSIGEKRNTFMKNIFWFGQVRTRSRMYDSISLACCFVMCVLIHSKSTHLVMLIWYGTMG